MPRPLAAEDLKLLHYRIRRILVRLQTLSEARAGAPLEDKPDTRRPTPESSPPPMARLDGKTDGPPSRDLSLFEHYKWRFERALGNAERLELLCLLAERDFWEHTGRGTRPAAEIRTERNRRVIQEYEGLSSIEVAVFERMGRTSVRRLRKEFGRDPETGERVRHVDEAKAALAA